MRHILVIFTLIGVSVGCLVTSAYFQLGYFETMLLFMGSGGTLGLVTGLYGYEA